MTLSRRHVLATAAGAAVATAQSAGPAAARAPLSGKAAPAFYRFRLGSFEVTALHDGIVQQPTFPENFVRNASKADVQKAYEAVGFPTDRLTLSFTPLVVNTGANLVLFDTGFADTGAPSVGTTVANLAAAGIDPKDIDTVVISHFHGDHISGVRNKAGAAVYPNAELMVGEAEWKFWMDDARMNAAPEAGRGGFANARRVFSPVAKDVKQFQWGKEILPGITAVQAEGHTPGHTAFAIASGNQTLIYMADLTNHPGVFAKHPEWSAVFDMDAATAVTTRKKLLDMAAAEKSRVCFYHATFPATGFIQKAGAGYDFVPAMWTNLL